MRISGGDRRSVALSRRAALCAEERVPLAEGRAAEAALSQARAGADLARCDYDRGSGRAVLLGTEEARARAKALLLAQASLREARARLEERCGMSAALSLPGKCKLLADIALVGSMVGSRGRVSVVRLHQVSPLP